MKNSFFPRLSTVAHALGVEPGVLRDDSPENAERKVTVPLRLLKHLLKLALRGVEIDPRVYAQQNLDIAQNIGADPVSLGDHFAATGYFEGRAFPVGGFDETYYLGKHRDVAEGIQKKLVRSAYEHYQYVGICEGRAPNSESERDVAAWAKVVNFSSEAVRLTRNRKASPRP